MLQLPLCLCHYSSFIIHTITHSSQNSITIEKFHITDLSHVGLYGSLCGLCRMRAHIASRGHALQFPQCSGRAFLARPGEGNTIAPISPGLDPASANVSLTGSGTRQPGR